MPKLSVKRRKALYENLHNTLTDARIEIQKILLASGRVEENEKVQALMFNVTNHVVARAIVTIIDP